MTPLVRGLLNIGANEFGATQQTGTDIFTELLTATINQAFNLVTSEVNGLPDFARKRITRKLLKSGVIDYPLVLFPDDVSRIKANFKIAKRIVEVGLPTINTLVTGLVD